MQMNPAGRLEAWFESLWWHHDRPPFILAWLSRLYAVLRNRDQRRRLGKASDPPLPMISVGNITVGGSSKTPFVIWLANRLQHRGLSPVVLCRGDGGKLKQPRIVRDYDQADIIGDEARLLFESCSCPVIVARDRVKGAKLAEGLGDILILDDGFQYRQLRRQCDVVLIPAEGIGNGWQLPAGPLREPISALGRAHIIIRTGGQEITPLGPDKEWHWYPCDTKLRQVRGVEQETPSRAVAISSIARPERFLDALNTAGIEVVRHFRFPDHHRYSAGDLQPCLRGSLPVIATSKDGVKLIPLWPDEPPLWILEQQGRGDRGLLDAILAPILSQTDKQTLLGV
jgi:tetraacyldisaccharide 4'-kinase